MFRPLMMSLVLFSSFTFADLAIAHCQVPCGIYGDEQRFDMIHEHIHTIEKAMKQITELEKSKNGSHQMVRWVITKEEHAQHIQSIVLDYFLAQRIKPDEKDRKKYANKLELLHKIIFQAMKAKQTTDQKHTEKLSAMVDEFKVLYFDKKAK